MSEEQKPFHEKRRQLFLYEKYFDFMLSYTKENTLPNLNKEIIEEEEDLQRKSHLSGGFADEMYEIFSLRYTAGASLDQLRTDFTQVVEAYERYEKKEWGLAFCFFLGQEGKRQDPYALAPIRRQAGPPPWAWRLVV